MNLERVEILCGEGKSLSAIAAEVGTTLSMLRRATARLFGGSIDRACAVVQ
jgi:hypothetical protein